MGERGRPEKAVVSPRLRKGARPNAPDTTKQADTAEQADTAKPPYYPSLPPNCPEPGAISMTGTFYRLVKGEPHDWDTQAMQRGVSACPKAVSLCRWQAVSLFGSRDGAQNKIDRYPGRFGGYSIAGFRMTPDMGVLLNDNPASSHHDWWPSDAFYPPPVIEEDG